MSLFISNIFLSAVSLISAPFHASLEAPCKAKNIVQDTSEVLWEDSFVQVQHEDGRIVVAPKKKVVHLSELSNESLVALERTIGKMESVFAEVFGMGDYVRSLPFHDETGIRATLIPSGAYQKDNFIDHELKVKGLLFQLGGRKNILPPIPKDAIQRIADAAKKILPANPLPIPLQGGTFSFKYSKEAFELLKNEVRDRGSDIQVAWNPDQPLDITFSTNSCVFCNPDIIARQRIADSTHNLVMGILYPYVKRNRHYLIIPKNVLNSHISKISQQTDEQIIDFYRLALKLDDISTNYFNVIEGSNEQGIIITRNGWFGGQTVPHLHHHIVLFCPEVPHVFMRDWLKTFGKVENKNALTDEEFKALRKELEPFFIE